MNVSCCYYEPTDQWFHTSQILLLLNNVTICSNSELIPGTLGCELSPLAIVSVRGHLFQKTQSCIPSNVPHTNVHLSLTS